MNRLAAAQQFIEKRMALFCFASSQRPVEPILPVELLQLAIKMGNLAIRC